MSRGRQRPSGPGVCRGIRLARPLPLLAVAWAVLFGVVGVVGVANPSLSRADQTIRVTSADDSGKGSLREAIATANRHPGSTIEVSLAADAVVVVEKAFPTIEAPGTRLLGGGLTLRPASSCRRPDGRRGCSGVVVKAADVVVRDLRIVGFTFDGVSVLGPDSNDVRILDVESVDNRDDGIGLSGGAGPVRIERCLLMGNGFRTKGKGLLVFDESQALLRDSIVVGNRDGVTVTRGAAATLERVLVVGNYDKGLGVSAAEVTGHRLEILSNGFDSSVEEAAPNGDGLRVGLGGRARLSRSRIAGSGDAGVVVLKDSSAVLRSTRVEGNRGGRTRVSNTGRLDER